MDKNIQIPIVNPILLEKLNLSILEIFKKKQT